MKEERKILKPIKSYYVPPKGENDKSINIHIFNDKNDVVVNGEKTAENIFSFIISKDDNKEYNVVDKKNILSIISTKDQNLLKGIISKIGDAIKKVYTLDREIFDSDLIEGISENLKSVDKTMWSTPNATIYISPEQKIINDQKPKYQKSTIYSENNTDDQALKATKPIIMIETLAKMGVIKIEKLEPNGDETKHVFSLTNGSPARFNLSVVRAHGLSGHKSEFVKDFYNDDNKQLGSGGLKVLTHLGDYGLFGETAPNESNIDKINRAKEYFKNQVLPNVNKNDMVFSSDDVVSKVYLGKSVSFQPITKNNTATNKLMKDFLLYRGLSENLIDDLFEKNIAFNGNSYVSRLQDEMKEDGSGFKPNYGYNNVPFLRLRKADGSFFGAELFKISRTSNKEKPFDYDKLNIGSLNGKSFMYGEMEEPKLAIVHEAIIDSLSSYEILRLAGADADAVKYISTQGSSHMRKFFSLNCGFWTDTREEVKPELRNKRTVMMRESVNYKEITGQLETDYKEILLEKDIVFLDTGDMPLLIQNQLGKLEKILNRKIRIENINSVSDVNFNNYDIANTVILNNENFSEFLDGIKLSYIHDAKLKDTVFKNNYKRLVEVQLTDKNKINIKRNIERFFGTKNIAFALDNDHAGLPFVILFAEMKRHFDINVSFMIPSDLKYKNFQGLMLKPMMEKFEKLCADDKHEDAYDLLHKYRKQKPICDNNDDLKHALAMPEAERNVFLKSKIKQLGIIGTDLYPKPASTSQRPKR